MWTFRSSNNASHGIREPAIPRSEFFNVFNNVNYALPNTNINSQQYGQINATSALPRVIQFALKLSF
jgi:hypothetical protein